MSDQNKAINTIGAHYLLENDTFKYEKQPLNFIIPLYKKS